MKKIIALLFVAFIALNASAQSSTDSWKPEQGNVGFTLGLNGLANIGVNAGVIPTGTLLFRYYIADDMAIRAGINFSSSNNTNELKDSVGLGTPRAFGDTKVVRKSSSWAVNIGIQKSFGDNARLEPYVGIDLWVGGGKSGKVDSTSSIAGTFTGGSFTDNTTVTVTPGSSFNFGLTPLAGFNWFIGKQFAIGAEFGWGLMMSNTKAGTFDGTRTTSTTVSGTTTTTTTTFTSATPSSKTTSIGGHASGLVTCSVFFNP